MNFGTLLFLNLVCLLEACCLKYLIDKKLIDHVINENFLNVIAFVGIKNIVILGIYQLYFWPQKNINSNKFKVLKASKIDKLIPAVPLAFWVYSPLYYIVFNLNFICNKNYKLVVINAWIMLLHACFWFVMFPTKLPVGFRDSIRNKKTDPFTRLLMKLVFMHDSEASAIPSMHCAFAVYSSFVIYNMYPNLAIVFPFLISVSCLLCKQHLIIDIIPGFILGALHGGIFRYLDKLY